MMTVCLLLAACSDDDIVENRVEEGLPVSVKFALTTPAPGEVATRATDLQETKVEKLALFFYKDENSTPIVYEVPNVGEPTQGTSSTNYFYSIEVPESAGLTSGNWYLYAIANWDKGFWNPDVTLDDFRDLNKNRMDNLNIMKVSHNLNITETAMLLTGKYGRDVGGKVTLERTETNNGENVLTENIHLRRSLAKIKFNFETKAGVTFTPERWELHEYCRTATLFERDGWTTKDGTVNNVSGTHPGSLQWVGTELPEDPDCFATGKLPYETANGIEFYMPENIQRAKVSGLDNKLMREKKNTDGTMMYAPDHATHIEVYGKYAGPADTDNNDNTPDEQVTADVKYTIYLGDFSTATGSADNFTVRRNTKYTFKVTINGVNNIIVEALTNVENQPGAEGDVIHAGNENTKALDAHYETEIIAIPKNLVENASEFGLQITTPKTNEIVNGVTGTAADGLESKDIHWLKFAKPATTTTFVKYPAQGNGLLTLNDVISDLKNKTYNNFIEANGNLYLQVFVDEYYYEDLVLSEFVNADDRIITLATSTSVSNDGNSSFSNTPIFSIQQNSIKSMFNLTDTSVNPIGLENRSDEATTSVLNADVNADNWTDNLAGTDMGNGYANCTGIIPIGERWDKYGDFATNTMKAEYNYGAYQWLSRNRDEDADGIIDAEEIKWFLPSVNQHNCIWIGKLALNDEAQFNEHHVYFTSTNGAYRTYWASEGAYGAYKPGSDYEDDQRVRCIRALRQPTQATTRVSTYNPDTRIITVAALDNNALRESGSQRGEYIAHTQDNINNRAPQAFQIAKCIATGMTAVVDGKPGDTYVPTVTTSDISSTKTSSETFYTYYTMTCHIAINNKIESRKYYWGTNSDGSGKKEIPDNGASVTMTFRVGSLSGNISQATHIYVFADNRNYVTLTPTSTTGIEQTTTILDSNQTVEGSTKSTFTASEILSGDWCKNYYEEADGSDKGQWRIPNQRELLLMMANQDAGGYRMPDYAAARTWYDGRDGASETNGQGLFYVQVPSGGGTRFITSQDAHTHNLVIVPVRDAQPERTSSSINSDSSYSSGGSIIK